MAPNRSQTIVQYRSRLTEVSRSQWVGTRKDRLQTEIRRNKEWSLMKEIEAGA